MVTGHYIFPVLVSLDKEKSGNPAWKRFQQQLSLQGLLNGQVMPSFFKILRFEYPLRAWVLQPISLDLLLVEQKSLQHLMFYFLQNVLKIVTRGWLIEHKTLS
jgi:hypothetical protein